MDREVSSAIEISVALIAISIVISIIGFTVFMGQDMSNDVAQESSKIISNMESGQLDEMCHQKNLMPSAGAYSIYSTYNSLIPKNEYTCNIIHNDGSDHSAGCIVNHLEGKVSVEIKKTEKGWYSMTIHKYDCEWFENKCTCK